MSSIKQKGEFTNHESKSPSLTLLTPNQPDANGVFERHSLLQSSDNMSGMKLQENPTAHLASSS